jgi:AraC-like DNA-binding protein
LAKADPNSTDPIPRFVFSTDQLPAELDEKARLSHWREIEEQIYGLIEVTYADDRPPWGRAELAQFGSVGVSLFGCTYTKGVRTPRCIARDGNDGFIFGINTGSALRHWKRDREVSIPTGSACLFSTAEPGGADFKPGLGTRLGLALPRRQLLALVPDADDLAVRHLDGALPAVQLLTRYIGALLNTDGVDDDQLLSQHVETTLLDLVALALGANRDAGEIAAMRGLRAARLQAALAEIKSGFTKPGFSAHHVAMKLGLSPRYVQSLLQATGSTLSERILELRLQKASAMLANHHYQATHVSQIAYSCGFNQVSYFNRCFRRRFGITPTAARDGSRPV